MMVFFLLHQRDLVFELVFSRVVYGERLGLLVVDQDGSKVDVTQWRYGIPVKVDTFYNIQHFMLMSCSVSLLLKALLQVH